MRFLRSVQGSSRADQQRFRGRCGQSDKHAPTNNQHATQASFAFFTGASVTPRAYCTACTIVALRARESGGAREEELSLVWFSYARTCFVHCVHRAFPYGRSTAMMSRAAMCHHQCQRCQNRRIIRAAPHTHTYTCRRVVVVAVRPAPPSVYIVTLQSAYRTFVLLLDAYIPWWLSASKHRGATPRTRQ